MSLFKFVARAAAAAPMVKGGLNAAQNANQLTGIIEEFIDSLPQQVKSQLSDVEPALLAKINGCTMVAASAAMVLGIKPRTAATILALQLVPTTLAGHPFWNYEGDARAQQIDEFVRNVGYTGGLLAIATAAKKSRKK